ncbi:MAG TPA: hypothetical protein VMR33_20400 [Candidatus Baltobacteraceae bacterium]|jgi:hypothetical protein|nr:hypothetical protein [Candidatus Baltobacteraceae bacterium]
MSTQPTSSRRDPTKLDSGNDQLTLGAFIAGGYRAWGKRKANGIIRLAIKARLIKFLNA